MVTAQADLIHVDQEFDCLREATYVEEADEITELLHRTVASTGSEAKAVYPRFRRIVGLHRLSASSRDKTCNKSSAGNAVGEVPGAVTAA